MKGFFKPYRHIKEITSWRRLPNPSPAGQVVQMSIESQTGRFAIARRCRDQDIRKPCRSCLSPQSSATHWDRKRARTCFEGPFGEVLRATDPMAKANPFRFSTKYQDGETDLLYYGYRYYNATTGRWLNQDPLGDYGFRAESKWDRPGNFISTNRPERFGIAHLLNLYAIVFNRPVGAVDRLGLAACSRCSHKDIEATAVRMGLEFSLRTRDTGREVGGRLCCNESSGTVYAAPVVAARPAPPGEHPSPPMADSRCQKCDKTVGDWHTHPVGSPTQLGIPGRETPVDLISIGQLANYLKCDDVYGYMTNTQGWTTRLNRSGPETIVHWGDGPFIPLPSEE